jgi:hypothetical protein
VDKNQVGYTILLSFRACPKLDQKAVKI